MFSTHQTWQLLCSTLLTILTNNIRFIDNIFMITCEYCARPSCPLPKEKYVTHTHRVFENIKFALSRDVLRTSIINSVFQLLYKTGK